MRNVSAELLARSRRLDSGKFAGVLEQNLRQDERVLLIDDCDAEIFEISQPSPKSGLVTVLTADRVLLLRGAGLMGGAKRPWILDLNHLEQVAVTAQGNLNLRFTEPSGEPHLWKLVFGNTEIADLWMQEIGRACGSEEEPEPGEFLPHLHDCLKALIPLATPDRIGTSFGPGSGLESAVQELRAHLRDASEARQCGRAMIVELLTQVPGDDPQARALEVMNVMDLRQGDGTVGREDLELAGAALTLIDQFRDPGSLWKLWEERDDVVLEILAWHCVARLRLATAGYAPPLDRPPARA